MRIFFRHRHEIMELLEGLNEEGEPALRQSCCGCVGFEIGSGPICHMWDKLSGGPTDEATGHLHTNRIRIGSPSRRVEKPLSRF